VLITYTRCQITACFLDTNKQCMIYASSVRLLDIKQIE
jgi:hypothetical protein